MGPTVVAWAWVTMKRIWCHGGRAMRDGGGGGLGGLLGTKGALTARLTHCNSGIRRSGPACITFSLEYLTKFSGAGTGQQEAEAARRLIDDGLQHVQERGDPLRLVDQDGPGFEDRRQSVQGPAAPVAKRRP